MKSPILIDGAESLRCCPAISPAMTAIEYEDDVRYRIPQKSVGRERIKNRYLQ